MSADDTLRDIRCRKDAFDVLLSNTDDIMYIVDADMTFRRASASFAGYMGFSDPDELIGMRVSQVIHDEETLQKHIHDDKTVLDTGESMSGFRETMRSANGQTHYLLCSKYPLYDENGAVCAVMSVSRDVTREYESREDYLQEIKYLMRISDDVYGAWLVDLTTWRIADAHLPDHGTANVLHFDTIDEYINHVLKTADSSDELRRLFSEFSLDRFQTLYKTGQRRTDIEYKRVMSDDSCHWVRLSIRFIADPVTFHLMAVITLNDISRVKIEQSELIKAAEIDSMTGVLNHDATFAHMERFLSGEGAQGYHALIMVDRDKLKQINDTLGHQVGDDIIVETARALQSVFRDTDIVGRVGGDEFLVMMKNIGDQKLVCRKAGELLQALQCICGPAENAMETTGSIGISFYNADRKTMDRLYAEADTALYRSKTDGRNRYTLFGTENDSSAAVGGRDPLADTVNLRTLLNSIDGGILIFRSVPGKSLKPVFFSDSFLTMMGGMTQEDAFLLYGSDFFGCIHPDERERVRSEYAMALESGAPLRTTYRLIGKNSDYHWLSSGTNITKNADGTADVYSVHTNIEKLMHREELLASDERRFRLAFSQTSRLLCEVDISTDTLSFYSSSNMINKAESHVSGLPDSVIDSGFIHEKSVESFRNFYEALRSGSSEGSGLFKLRYFSTGRYGWASMSYQMVFDSNGMPQKAIGSIEELPNIARAQERLEKEEMFMKNVGDDLLVTMRVNLSKDKIDYNNVKSEYCLTDHPIENYTDFVDSLSNDSPYPEDIMLIQVNLAHDSLLDAFSAGKRWTSVEYRRVEGGEIRWTRAMACLLENPVTHDLYAFIYIGDVEKRRSIESVVPVTVTRDPNTHLYMQSSAEELADSLMRSTGTADRQYSLAMIRMLGLPLLSARIGEENLEVEKTYLCRFLCTLLDGDCIVGKYNNDSIIAFCLDVQSDNWMRDKIDSAVWRVNEMRDTGNIENHVRLVCGIATENARNANLTGMLSQAQRVCDAYQNTGTDGAYTFEQYVSSFRVSDEAMKKVAFQSVSQEEMTRPLFGCEKEALAECMAAMLAADRYDASISGALGVMGKYYNAQRVYTLSLLSDGNTVSGLHEWVSQGRHSTINQLAGLSLDRLPMFKRALITARPIVLDGRSRREVHNGEPPWCFISVPIILDTRVQGFLCVENPEKHKADVALPCKVLPIIMHERSRFGLNASGMKIAGRDELTGLHDRSAYENAMQTFNPDAYHTVGVMYISVANVREYKKENGNSYENDMLVFASQTLLNIIKRAQIYRISKSEFAVISVNLAQEAFQGQCARCQSVMLRRYPKMFSFGEAWSDKGITARKLLSSAESSAHGGVERVAVPASMLKRASGGDFDIKDAITDGRMFIMLQPQVDMRTEKTVGAEVLARCRDSSGNIILPSEFVHSLEKAGMIRELDYYVLNEAFATLQCWLENGLVPIPLSVNFSRQTMLSPTVLASALAIRSRYDVPDHLVEIEITESIGNYDPALIRGVMGGMNSQGFRFALDDLGSEYSSLKTLGDFNFDAVKLDRSLIGNFTYNSMSHSVVESIISVCAKNNVRCIAEGVEAQMHAKELMDAGCIFAQGYYYGKPMPVEDFCKKYLQK